MGPFAAALINRYGLRRIATIALSLIATGLLLSLGMTQVWQLIVLWGFVLGIGTGMTALVLGATVATRWFTARRGLVVGLLTASSATGQLVFLPLLASLTERVGWRVSILRRQRRDGARADRRHVADARPALGRRACRPMARACRSVRACFHGGALARSRRCATPRARACSGSCSRPSSSAAPAPTG